MTGSETIKEMLTWQKISGFYKNILNMNHFLKQNSIEAQKQQNRR